MLQALRQSAHGTGRLLLPLLLLAWLSLVCGHCVALAGDFDAVPMDHHGAAETGHDCCPKVETDPCLGGDCEHTADIQQAPVNGKSGEWQYTPVPLTAAYVALYAMQWVALPVHPPASFPPDASPPLYLRNCVFLI